jgi:transketolase
VARTVRGKGVPSLEGRVDRWFCNFSATEVEQLLAEMRGRGAARLVAEPQVVR